MRSDGIVALVTGADAVLDAEVARRLARRGFTVYLASRDLAAAPDLGRPGAEVVPIEIDAADVESVGRAAARIVARHGRLDLLVQTAGAGATSDSGMFELVSVTSAMLPLLRRSAAPKIVHIASTDAVSALTVQYAEALRRRHEYAHIKVDSVTPGQIQDFAAAGDGSFSAPSP